MRRGKDRRPPDAADAADPKQLCPGTKAGLQLPLCHAGCRRYCGEAAHAPPAALRPSGRPAARTSSSAARTGVPSPATSQRNFSRSATPTADHGRSGWPRRLKAQRAGRVGGRVVKTGQRAPDAPGRDLAGKGPKDALRAAQKQRLPGIAFSLFIACVNAGCGTWQSRAVRVTDPAAASVTNMRRWRILACITGPARAATASIAQDHLPPGKHGQRISHDPPNVQISAPSGRTDPRSRHQPALSGDVPKQKD